MKDISRSAHPLDQDQAVARAWGQPAWADYSGVSRTWQGLGLDEARHIVRALETISRPFMDREVTLALREQGYLVFPEPRFNKGWAVVQIPLPLFKSWNSAPI